MGGELGDRGSCPSNLAVNKLKRVLSVTSRQYLVNRWLKLTALETDVLEAYLSTSINI